MAAIKPNILPTIFNNMICEDTIKIHKSRFADNKTHVMKFEVYDGFAYCPNDNGKEYGIVYPKIEFVEKCAPMLEATKMFNGTPESDVITVTDILQAFGDIFEIEDNTSIIEITNKEFTADDVHTEHVVEVVETTAS